MVAQTGHQHIGSKNTEIIMDFSAICYWKSRYAYENIQNIYGPHHCKSLIKKYKVQKSLKIFAQTILEPKQNKQTTFISLNYQFYIFFISLYSSKGRGIPSISGVGSICAQITFGPGDGLGLKSSSLACMTKVWL